MSCRYFFHISDLHFGARRAEAGQHRLKALLSDHVTALGAGADIRFIVTGDGVDTPNRKNGRHYREFSAFLESLCGSRPLFVLGNHDTNPYGLAFGRNRREHIRFAGTFPRIKIYKDIKTVFLLLNSNTKGYLAEGKIGSAQMAEAGRLLNEVDNLDEYRIVAVLHHHLVPIKASASCEEPWYKRIIPKWLRDPVQEKTVHLHDAPAFIQFLKEHNICTVLHGHKHIPAIVEHKGIHVIACGSSTGLTSHAHKDPSKTHLCYNLLTITKDAINCTQFEETQTGAGAKAKQTTTIPTNFS